MAETASYWSDTFTDRRGNVHALAKLSVFVDGTSTPATLYTDETKLTVAADHVVDVDGDGKAEFYADPGFYSTELRRAGALMGTSRVHVGVQKGAKGDTGLTGPQGDVGPQGDQGVQGVQGDPGVVWQGDWVSTTAYAVDDVVAYDGSTWVAVAASTGVTPSVAAAEWDLFTAQGATGPKGDQGVKGDTGDQGLVWRGDWVSTTAYAAQDGVAYGGESWIATAASTGVTPSDAAVEWDLLAEAGTDGQGVPATALSPTVTAPSQAGVVGASTDFARQDHEHPSDEFLTPAAGNTAYEAKVSRTGATAGEVPILQADNTLAFGAVSGTSEGFRAYRSTSQALSAAVFTTIIFDTEVRDQGADYNPATGEWTVPATGWYDVAGSVFFSSLAAGERYDIAIYVNGVSDNQITKYSGTANLAVDSIARPLYLAAADVVTIRAQRGNAGNVNGSSNTTVFTAKRRY